MLFFRFSDNYNNNNLKQQKETTKHIQQQRLGSSRSADPPCLKQRGRAESFFIQSKTQTNCLWHRFGSVSLSNRNNKNFLHSSNLSLLNNYLTINDADFRQQNKLFLLFNSTDLITNNLQQNCSCQIQQQEMFRYHMEKNLTKNSEDDNVNIIIF